MSDPIQIIERLAAQIRAEDVFSLDVADRVIPRIRRTRRAPVRSALTILACTLAAAALVLPLLDRMSDPWNVLFMLFAG